MCENKLNFAAIDIGSNAVRLLIKSVNEGDSPSKMTKTVLLRVPLRLGGEVFRDGVISKSKAKQLLRTMKAFRLLMKVYHVTAYRACATSAMRDAANGESIVRDIHNMTGVKIEIIGGLEEARMVYDSHISDLLDQNLNYLYVDVGGGSTEVSLIAQGALVGSNSYNVGTVRLLSGTVHEETLHTLDEDLQRLTLEHPHMQLVGTGGNISKLYRLRGDKQSGVLLVEELQSIYQELQSMSYEERIEHLRLNPDRADVIVPAAELFLRIAGLIHTDRIVVPTIGISDGIAHALYVRYLAEQSDEQE
ncbi:MAG: Ppx/GppA family phosphatase [Alistipes sp.]|nr:Ppx/GppA family phosphatase [Alistipes sp.]